MQCQARAATELLQACAHPARLVLLCQLSQEELNVGELEQRLGIHQPSLSQQLGVLRRQGLIEGRREGQLIFYRLANEEARELIQSLYRIYCNK
ncbi:ArsR/SmtB family transcription factor [Marinospirillum alkaliphilum]|nr:metalloregulator ArsR/SmtB family transcription factor [Marinospirillum alkaliphilum]